MFMNAADEIRRFQAMVYTTALADEIAATEEEASAIIALAVSYEPTTHTEER